MSAAPPDYEALFRSLCQLAQTPDAVGVVADMGELLCRYTGAAACHVLWLNDQRSTLRVLGKGAALSFPIEREGAEACPACAALRTNAVVSVRDPAVWDISAIAPLVDRAPALIAAPLGYESRGALGVLLLTGGKGLDSAVLDAKTAPPILSAIAALIDVRVRHMQKDLSLSQLATSYDRANADRQRLRTEKARSGSGLLLGASEPIQTVREHLHRAAQVTTPVLLLGETGSGKELAARELHAQSSRANKPFVAVNCAALAPQLLESELFGHSKGAFTNASTERKGLMREADGGVLFLDEVGEMPPALQSALLRSLQERTIRPVGTNREIKTDFRLICATHRDLEAMVARGDFRQDLFYRIRRIVVTLPPLRSLGEDLLLLTRRFVDAFNVQEQSNILLDEDAWDALRTHPFPGNVRELQTIVEQACLDCFPNGRITAETFAAQLMPPERTSKRAEILPFKEDVTDLRQTVEAYEKRLIAERLAALGGDKLRAAQSLNLPKRTFADRCKRYNL